MTFKRHKSDFLTDIGSIPKAFISGTVPGMAHFAGTGPADKTCGDCAFWVSMPRTSKMQCRKYTQMTKAKGSAIPSLTWACRHFEGRSK